MRILQVEFIKISEHFMPDYIWNEETKDEQKYYIYDKVGKQELHKLFKM